MNCLIGKLIKILAFRFWIKRGRPLGDDWYDWFKAENIVRDRFFWIFVIIFCFYLFSLPLMPDFWPIQFSWLLVAILIILINLYFKFGMTLGRFVGILSLFMAFQTLTLQNKSLLKEIEHFELSNRPFISADNPVITITDKELNAGMLPELSFLVLINLKNHGKLPAFIKNVGCVVKSLSGDTYEPFMPYPKDKEQQIENFDLFPNDSKPFLIKPHINIDAVRRLMLGNIQNAGLKNKDSEFWKRNINEIVLDLDKYREPFYLIFQIEYYMISDDKKMKPYFYSVQFRVEQNVLHYFKSNSKKWFDFNDKDEIHWL